MKRFPFQSTACPLCGSTRKQDYDVLYPANFKQNQIASLFSARRLPDGIHYQLVRCKNDHQVRSQPILGPEVLDALYKESEFNYAHEVPHLVDTYVRALQPVLTRLQPSDRILEIGCGSGFVLSALYRLGFHKLSGAEPSKAAIAQADPKIKKLIVQKIFKKGLFPAKTFACIFLLQTLDHIPDPEHFFKDCWSQLKPGGFLVSFHHNVDSWSAKILGEKSPIFDIEHTCLYSHETSRKIFEKYGFEVREVFSPTNTLSLFHLCWLLPLPRVIKKNVLTSNSSLVRALQRVSVRVPLGNTCIIGQKPLK